MVSSVGDSFVADRLVAIKNALNAVGITTIHETRLPADDADPAKSIEASLKANPKTILMFAVDRSSSAAVKKVVDADVDHRLFVVSCYTGEETVSELSKMTKFAAVAQFSPMRLLRKAVSTAAALVQGQDVPPVVECAVNVTDSTATAAMYRTQAVRSQQTAESAEKGKK